MIKIQEIDTELLGKNMMQELRKRILRIDKRCYKRDVRFTEATLDSFLNRHAKLFLIKHVGTYETMIGYMLLYIEHKECYLTSIAIIKQYQNQGLGKEMFERYLIESVIAKCKKMSLHAVNPSMIHIAIKHGFKKVRTNKEYYGKVNAVLMEKRI